MNSGRGGKRSISFSATKAKMGRMQKEFSSWDNHPYNMSIVLPNSLLLILLCLCHLMTVPSNV